MVCENHRSPATCEILKSDGAVYYMHMDTFMIQPQPDQCLQRKNKGDKYLE